MSESEKEQQKVSGEELDAIVERLYSSGLNRPQPPAPLDRGPAKSQDEVEAIVGRLYSGGRRHDPPQPELKESPKVNPEQLDAIVERLFTTSTSASDPPAPSSAESSHRKAANNEEINEIYKRLMTAHTKSSLGGQTCKTSSPLKTPGLGLKMLPAIEGLDERFKGKSLSEEQAVEIMTRLQTTQTGASQARRDFPRILLYPERTILHNNTTRIRDYQDSGSMSRQKELARREKWYN